MTHVSAVGGGDVSAVRGDHSCGSVPFNDLWPDAIPAPDHDGRPKPAPVHWRVNVNLGSRVDERRASDLLILDVRGVDHDLIIGIVEPLRRHGIPSSTRARCGIRTVLARIDKDDRYAAGVGAAHETG